MGSHTAGTSLGLLREGGRAQATGVVWWTDRSLSGGTHRGERRGMLSV